MFNKNTCRYVLVLYILIIGIYLVLFLKMHDTCYASREQTLILTVCGSDGFLFALGIDTYMANALLTNVRSIIKSATTIAFVLSLKFFKSLYLDLK